MDSKYSQQTQELIDRMCRNVEREDFQLDKEKAQECLLKTYDLFGLKRPAKIVWCKDIFDEIFARSAGSAWSAWSARSAGSAWSARSAWSAWSARSAWSSLDYDFDYYVFEFEYCKNPGKEFIPNENDFKYLEYCELLMQAKEYGLGYRVEWEDTLYLVPTPIVRIDEQNRFHSTKEPAIRWKEAAEFYYLHGVNFKKDLWNKIVEKKITAKEVLSLTNIEQRMAALKIIGVEAILEGATLVDSVKGYDLYEIKNVFTQTAYYLKYKDPSTDRIYMSGIDPQVGANKSAIKALAWKFCLDEPEDNEPIFEQES